MEILLRIMNNGKYWDYTITDNYTVSYDVRFISLK